MNIEKLLRGLKGALENADDDDLKVEVGTVSPELLQRFKKFVKADDFLEDEIELFMKQQALEVKRLMEEKFGDRKEELAQLRTELWNEISDFVLESREEALQIDQKTGVVRKVVKPNSKPESRMQ